MEKGDKVKIYQKPLTKENFEGEAILIRKLFSCDTEAVKSETWLVEFPDKTQVVRTF